MGIYKFIAMLSKISRGIQKGARPQARSRKPSSTTDLSSPLPYQMESEFALNNLDLKPPLFKSTSVLAPARTRSKLQVPPTCSRRCSPEVPASTLRPHLPRKSRAWVPDSMLTTAARDSH